MNARVHNHTRTINNTMCSILCGHTPIPILMYGLRVMSFYIVYKNLFFVMFIVVLYHTHVQSFSLTCPISQLCAQICPYYNVLPGAVFVVFTRSTMFAI